MIYNYLELDSINKWPKEKKMLLFKLLDIEEGSDKTLSKIKVTSEYIMAVESRLNQNIQDTIELDSMSEIKKLKKEEQQLYADLTGLIKDRMTDDYKHEENIVALTYIYYILRAVNVSNEVQYFLGYLSKAIGMTNPNEFKFNENNQFIFEGIIHSAMELYNHGGANRGKVTAARDRFVQEIEAKKEEQLGRTEQLSATTIQALRELGYSSFTNENYNEVLAKIVEIESRKV